MKSLWGFPSRAAAIEALGLEGFVAAVMRLQKVPLSTDSSVLRLDKNKEPPLDRKHPDCALLDREPDVAVA